ncbi:MAG: hypothetical protein IPH45_08450 [Bacteroidales bacterium]|nr:hypothetical protein [Bacteroidales bacterium]
MKQDFIQLLKSFAMRVSFEYNVKGYNYAAQPDLAAIHNIISLPVQSELPVSPDYYHNDFKRLM